MTELNTQEKLRKIGKEEFLDKGYKDASLREIAKKAGFTLGAFYGYYDSKESLFDDIVKEPAQTLIDYYVGVQTGFSELPPERQEDEMDQVSNTSLIQMLDILYEHFDAFKLIFFRSKGTRYETYLQKLIDVEIDYTRRFIDVLKAQGHRVDIDEELSHILISAMFFGFVEVIDHDMRKEKAMHYITQLRAFYSAGWHKLLGF